MECLGLYNKPKANVHPGHKLTGPKEEEENGHLGSSAGINRPVLGVGHPPSSSAQFQTE
jgi:hypothetical protein